MFRQQIMTCISGTCIMQYLKIISFCEKGDFPKEEMVSWY